jgi:hypothetical protein
VAYTNWLVNAKNLEELKALYYTLARSHHPDLGGSTDIMQQINAEYSLRVKLFKSGFNPSATTSTTTSTTTTSPSRPARKAPSGNQKNPPKSNTEWGRLNITRDAWEAYHAVCEIRESERYPFGIVIKIIDGKVQVGGRATYYYRERLKALGFAWNATARYWFFVKKPPVRKAS